MEPRILDISALSISELKALAYDVLLQIQQGQVNLKALETEIQKKQNEALQVSNPENPQA